jgi:hypothetical protein
MLPSLSETVTFKEIEAIPPQITIESHIGHPDLAHILKVPVCRDTVVLTPGEKFIIAQYVGPRLAEGTTVLPVNAQIKYVVGEVFSPYSGPDAEE